MEHKYVWQGSKLVSEYFGGKELEFFYDESGKPYAFSYKTSANAIPSYYYYVTNLQGDVVSILDANGNEKASYSYNAWGKILSATGDMASVNPLRYRGYYYDDDTGFYYLKGRYYDPQIQRFINADGLASTGQSIIGTNMFAYCGNNPVSRADSNGDIWHIVAGVAVGAVAGVLTKAVTNFISGKKITTGLVTAGIAGAVSGGLAASGVGLVGQVVGNAIIGAGNNFADQIIGKVNKTKTDGYDFGSILLDGVFGAIAGFAGGPGAGNKGLKQIGLTIARRAKSTLTHKGVKASFEVLAQGLTYFWKNARHIVKPLGEAIAKSSGSIIFNNTIKVVVT